MNRGRREAVPGEEQVAVTAYRCPRCGAPLPVTPETVVAVCPACGYPVWFDERARGEVLVAPAERASLTAMLRSVEERMPRLRRLRPSSRLVAAELYYAPFYEAGVRVSASYQARTRVTLEKEECRTETVYDPETGEAGEEEECETEHETVEVEVGGSFKDERSLLLVARRAVYDPVLAALPAHVAAKRPGFKRLGEVDWGSIRGEVLASEITSWDALAEARDLACEEAREQAERRIREEAASRAEASLGGGWTAETVEVLWKRIPCRAENRGLSPLELIPYARYAYRYKGGVYNVYLAAWSGEPIQVESPVTGGQRASRIMLGALASSVLGGVGGGLALSGMGQEALLAGAALTALGAVASYRAAGRATAVRRVETLRPGERKGESVEVHS